MDNRHKNNTQEIIYTCPMHPEVRRDMPGMCPECGMAPVPMKKKMNKHLEIQKTAIIPLLDLVKCNVNNANKILNELKYPKQFCSSEVSYLAESRYKSSEKIIKDNHFKQVVELGSGFSPHAINLKKHINKYIEVDFLDNSKTKQKIIGRLFPNNQNIIYMHGNVFQKDIWQKIWKKIDKENKIAIFAEGFMQYTDKNQRKFLLGQIKKVLKKIGGAFFFEDSLTFHPEFKKIKKLKNISKKMSRLSKNKNLLKYISQEELTKEFETAGFQISRINAYNDLVSKDYQNNVAKSVISNFKHWQLTL